LPLSDDEEQKLDLIAKHFYAEDPKLADTLGLPTASRAFRVRAAYGVLLALGGLGVLILSVVLAVTALGVLAFIMMLIGTVLIHSVWRTRQFTNGFPLKDRRVDTRLTDDTE